MVADRTLRGAMLVRIDAAEATLPETALCCGDNHLEERKCQHPTENLNSLRECGHVRVTPAESMRQWE
jgi:hypothetical protein